MVKIIQSNEFSREVLNNDGVVLVDFYADWCGPCKMISPILTQLATEMGEGVKVRKVNVESSRDIAMNYGIMSIPTLLLFKNGQKVETMVGLQQMDALRSRIQKWI